MRLRCAGSRGVFFPKRCQPGSIKVNRVDMCRCVRVGGCGCMLGGDRGAASPGPGRAGFRKKSGDPMPDPVPDPVPDPMPDPMQRPFFSVNRCIASIY